MKKSKLLLPLTGIMAIGAAAPMIAMTGCSKKVQSNFQTDSWSTVITNCKSAKAFYNAYMKAADEEEPTETEAYAYIKEAIIESASQIKSSTDEYRFERKILTKTPVGEIEMKVRLIDIGHDEGVTNTKTTFTFEYVDCATMSPFDSDTLKTWDDATGDTPCAIKKYLNEVFIDCIPSEVKNAIVEVKKETDVSKTAGEDKLEPKILSEKIFILGKREFGIENKSIGLYKPSDYTYSFYSDIAKVDGDSLKNPVFNKTFYGLEDYKAKQWTRTRRALSTTTQYVWDYEAHEIRAHDRLDINGVAPVFNI